MWDKELLGSPGASLVVHVERGAAETADEAAEGPPPLPISATHLFSAALACLSLDMTHPSRQYAVLSRKLLGLCLLEALAPSRSIFFLGTYGLYGKTWKNIISCIVNIVGIIPVVVFRHTSLGIL